METSTLKQRREFEERIIQQWITYAKKYRELLDTYNDLLEQKRKLGLRLRRVKKSTIDDLPTIEFFYCTTIEEAEAYLQKLNNGQIYRLMFAIDRCVNGYSFVTISNRIGEYRYEIKRYNSPRSTLGYDPEYCRSANHNPQVKTSSVSFSDS